MNSATFEDDAADESGQLIEYRSPHALAIITLVLGLLCFLALVRPTFWILPLLTVVLGAVTLRILAVRPEKIGRQAALLGMALALVFGVWAVSRYVTRQHWLAGQARSYAESWLELIRQHKFREAHQLHVNRSKRAASGTSLEAFYAKERYAQNDLDSFFNTEPLKQLVEIAPQAAFAFVGRREYLTDIRNDRIVLEYVATYDERGRKRELPFRLLMLRALDGTIDAFVWEVEGVAGVP